MKTSLIIGTLLVALTVVAQQTTYVPLYNSAGTASYCVATNDAVTLTSIVGNGATVTGNTPGGNVKLSVGNGPYTGFTNVVMTNGNNSFNYASLQIIHTPATCTVSNYVPADAIVIPASATGNVNIILESSPDLVNWTAASPGVYGPSAATNRFFRVRAAVQ